MNYNIIWYRNDLRTLDHSGIYQSQKNKQPTFAVYYICKQQWHSHDYSEHKINYIYDRLNGLKLELDSLNIPLFIFDANTYTDSVIHLCKVIKKHNANHVFLNSDYELDEINRDKQFTKLIPSSCKIHAFDDNIFCHPESIKTGKDTPFKVFTAFKNKITPFISALPGCYPKPKSLEIKPSIAFKKTVDITTKSKKPIFEKDSISNLRKFCKNKSEQYLDQRDIPNFNTKN